MRETEEIADMYNIASWGQVEEVVRFAATSRPGWWCFEVTWWQWPTAHYRVMLVRGQHEGHVKIETCDPAAITRLLDTPITH